MRIVVARCQRVGRLIRLAHTGERELRPEPREFSVIHFRVEVNVPFGARRDLQPVVNRVGSPGRNQVNIHDRARGPGIPLVDRISVRIDLQRAVEMRTRIHRTFALVFHFTAGKDGLTLIIACGQFDPAVKRIHGPAREEVSQLAGSHHHIHAIGPVAAHRGRDSVQGPG